MHEKKSNDQASTDDETKVARIRDLEKELQASKLDIDELKSQLTSTKHDLQVQTQQGANLRDIQIRESLTALFEELSGPLAQLLTQNNLQHVQGKSIKSGDIDGTIKRLVQKLEKYGLEISEEVGSTTLYDPNEHEALALGDTIETGDRVLIRMYGISFEGKTLRRASVSKLPNSE